METRYGTIVMVVTLTGEVERAKLGSMEVYELVHALEGDGLTTNSIALPASVTFTDKDEGG